MAKYLVTGGAGFIGTNTMKHLLEEGHEVVSFDNYSSGRRQERVLTGVQYVEGDVRDLEELNELCKSGFDGIVHLAALPRVTYSVERPLETHDVNVNGTLNVLLAARDNKIKRVVFASSSSVYGNPEVLPAVEHFEAKPISPYALHKYTGETYARLFHVLYGLETVSLRYFNVYGPYFDPDGPYALVIGKFIQQVKNGQPMTVCGDGEYRRDYTHVKDVCRANLLALSRGDVGKGEVINIGNGHPHTVNELVKMIGGESVAIPERPGDVRKTEADISLAKNLLDWEPKIKLEDGIEELKKEWGI